MRNWNFCRLLDHGLLIDNGYIHSYHLTVSYIFAYPVAANTGSLKGELLDHGIFHAIYLQVIDLMSNQQHCHCSYDFVNCKYYPLESQGVYLLCLCVVCWGTHLFKGEVMWCLGYFHIYCVVTFSKGLVLFADNSVNKAWQRL